MGIGVPMGLQCSITAIGSVIMQWAVNAGQHGCRRRHRRQQDDEPADRPAGERVGTAMATSRQNLGAARMDRVRKALPAHC